MKRIFINGTLLVAIVMSLGIAASAQRILGGYKNVSTEDAQVTAAAEFAVGKKAEEQEGLSLVSIEKAEIQSASGTNFRLCLTVSLDEEEQQVQTVIHKNLKQIYSITNWTVKECGESASQPAAANPAMLFNVGNHIIPGVKPTFASAKFRVKAPQIDKELVFENTIDAFQKAVVYSLRAGLPD